MTSSIQPHNPALAGALATTRLARVLVGTERPRWVRLAVAVALVALAVATRYFLLGSLGRGTAYITFYPAVMFAAVYGGGAAGLFTTALSAGFAFFWVQSGTLSPAEQLAFAVFNATSLFVSGLSELLHRTVANFATGETRLQSTLDNLGEAVLLAAPDGRVLAANPAACRLFARTETALRSLARADLIDPSDSRVPALLAERDRTGRCQGRLRFRRPDGTTFEGEITSVLFTSPGTPALASIAIRDLTTQVAATAQLEQAAREWQTTFDATRDAVWVLDRDCRILRANRAAVEFFARSADEMVGRHCWEIAHGSTKPLPDCPLQRAAHSLRREAIELAVGERWFEVVVDPILDPAGRFAGAVHTMGDITARRLAEVERNLLATTIGASRNEIYIFDAGTLRFLYVNAGALTNLGFTLAQLRAMTPLDLKPEHTAESFAAILAPLRRSEQAVAVFETAHRRADGSTYPVEVHLQLLVHADRKVFLAVINDITER